MTTPLINSFLSWTVGNYIGRIIYQTLLSSDPVSLGAAVLDPSNVFVSVLAGVVCSGIYHSVSKMTDKKTIDNLTQKESQKPELASMSAVQLLDEIRGNITSIESLAGKLDTVKKNSYMSILDQLSIKLESINLIENPKERQQEQDNFKKHLLVGANMLQNSKNTIKVSQEMQSKTADQAQQNSLVIVDLLMVFLKQSFLGLKGDSHEKNKEDQPPVVFKTAPTSLSSMKNYK